MSTKSSVVITETFFAKGMDLARYKKKEDGSVEAHLDVVALTAGFIIKTKRVVTFNVELLNSLQGKYLPVHSQSTKNVARLLIAIVDEKKGEVRGHLLFKDEEAIEAFRAEEPTSTGIFISPLITGFSTLEPPGSKAEITTRVTNIGSVLITHFPASI